MINDTLISGIIRARKKGYSSEFRFENNCLIDRETQKKYKSNECDLVKYERFEGMSDPADASVLFLLECLDGNKGYISSAYGIYADENLLSFMGALRK